MISLVDLYLIGTYVTVITTVMLLLFGLWVKEIEKELKNEWYECHICGKGIEAHDKAGRCPGHEEFGKPPTPPEHIEGAKA